MGRTKAQRVLVLGDYRQALVALRSLKRNGYIVAYGVQSNTPNTYLHYSRCIDEVWTHPPRTDSTKYVEALLQYVERHPGAAIIPVGDSDADLLVSNRELLKNCYICASSGSIVALCHDKQKMCEIARKVQAPVPESISTRNMKEASAAIRKIGTACVLKPRSSIAGSLGKKAVFVENEQELRRLLPAWPQDIDDILVQRKVPGLRHNYDFAAVEGDVVSACQSKIFRTDSYDYSGVAVDGVSIPLSPKLDRYARAIIRELRYTGIGLMQFLHDEERNDFFFLELNPRLGAPAACAYFSGQDLPLWAVRCAVGDVSGPDPQEQITPGLRCNWFTGDVAGLLHSFNHREIGLAQSLCWLGGITRSFILADRHSTFTLNDPLPTIIALAQIALSVLEHLKSPGMLRKRRVPAVAQT